MSPKTINVAVLGFGMSAQVFHIPFFQTLPQFNLTTVLERSATAEKSAVRDKFPNLKVVTSLSEILQDSSIDLVCVSTINDTHYEYSKQCLQAGKHVIVEKPLTPESQQARELAELSRAKKLVLAVYQNRRWDADFLTVKKLIKEGAFGELSEFQSSMDRYRNEPGAKAWKETAGPGAGAAYDLGSHLIDQILDLFGRPKAVTAILRNSRSIGDANVPDSFLIHLHYDAKESAGRKIPLLATAKGSILSLLSPQLRYTMKGTEAAFVKFGVDVQEDQLKAGAAAALSKSDYGVEPSELSGKLHKLANPSQPETITSEKGNYLAWFENVAEAIQTGDREKLIVTPEAAALTIEIIEAATLSSQQGKTIQL